MKFLISHKKIFSYLAIFLLFLGMRVPSLGSDILNSDGLRWHKRSEWFLNALKQREFEDTYQHYQPGVTLMWLNTVPKYLDFELQLRHTNQPKTLEHSGHFQILHMYSKLSLVLVLTVLLGIQMFFISKLFSTKTAALFGLLMSVEPYLVGIDRYMHLTSLEAYSAFAAFLAVLYWLKTKNIWLLGFSGILFTFSILSKLTTLGLVPVFVGILLYDFYKSKNFKPFLIFTLFSIVSLFIMWPALWVIPKDVFLNLYDAIFNAVNTDIRGEEITGWLSLFYYDLILAFRMSPITYGLLIASVINIKRLVNNIYVRYLLLFALCYWVVLTVPAKKIDRYSIVLFPTLLLVVSYYLTLFSPKKLKLVLTAIFLYTIFVVFAFFPVYSAHYSPVLGGYKTALKVGIYDNSGEGFAQAAIKLNALGRDTVVYVPHNTDTFSYFYKGKVAPEFNSDVNYVVVSVDHLDSVPEECILSNFIDISVIRLFQCSHP